MSRSGFTLIELLVVIGIIATLSAIGLVSFSAVSRKGRDGKREVDITQTRAALELYRSQYGRYPAGDFSAMLGTLQTAEYISAPLPADPKPDPYTQYSYRPNATGATYCVCARLERANSGNSTNLNCASGVGVYYCMTQP